MHTHKPLDDTMHKPLGIVKDLCMKQNDVVKKRRLKNGHAERNTGRSKSKGRF